MAGDEGRKFLLVVEEPDTRDSEAGGLTECLPCLGAWSALAPLLNTRMLHLHFRKHLDINNKRTSFLDDLGMKGLSIFHSICK